jgi:hypothetical protein
VGTKAWINGQRFSSGTSTGLVDFTISGMGTPTAVLVVGGTGSGASLSVGAATATDEKWFRETYVDATSDPIVSNTTLNSTGVLSERNSSGTVDFAADFNSFIADGVRLNITTAPGTTRLFNIIFFGGTSLTAKAILHAVDGTDVGDIVDVTSPGFEPEVVFSVPGNSGHASLGTASQA